MYYYSGTTTTAFACGQSCLNQSWTNTSGGLAWWRFEGSYADQIGNYNRSAATNASNFVTGYIGQAAFFNASVPQIIYTSFIPLNNASFTVEAWIKPIGYPNSQDHGIVGLCPTTANDQCLHITIRNQKFYYGFFADDLVGVTTLPLGQWAHTMFVFDVSTRRQVMYLNGILEGQRTASSVLKMTSGNFSIGGNEKLYGPNNVFQV